MGSPRFPARAKLLGFLPPASHPPPRGAWHLRARGAGGGGRPKGPLRARGGLRASPRLPGHRSGGFVREIPLLAYLFDAALDSAERG